jgi:hypothetical protein
MSQLLEVKDQGKDSQLRSRSPCPSRMKGEPRIVRFALTMPVGTLSTQYIPDAKQLVTLAVWILEAVQVDGGAESVDGDGALHGGRIDGDEGVLVVGGELKGPVDVRSVVPARDRLPGAYLDV